jgi:hypothetical protein
MMPPWIEALRIIAIPTILLLLPLMLWQIHRTHRLHQRWQESEDARRESEDARRERWQGDINSAAKLLEECSHLRAQAEVSLAMARRQVANGQPHREDAD